MYPVVCVVVVTGVCVVVVVVVVVDEFDLTVIVVVVADDGMDVMVKEERGERRMYVAFLASRQFTILESCKTIFFPNHPFRVPLREI